MFYSHDDEQTPAILREFPVDHSFEQSIQDSSHTGPWLVPGDYLKDLSSIDGLTGIANRRRFNESVEAEWKRCARSGSSLSLL